MFKKLTMFAVLAGIATAAGAVTVDFIPGGGGVPATDVLVSNFNNSANDGLVSGSNYFFLTNTSGIGALPGAGDGSRYLSVLGGGQATISFAPTAYVGFDYGSADWYNTVTINLVGGGTKSFGGLTIAPPANGNQSWDATNGRARFFAEGGELISGITLVSSINSLEIDNVSVAGVPEPANWAMMIVGFGLTGAAMRRRRTARLVAA